jgi:hypothetical protein
MPRRVEVYDPIVVSRLRGRSHFVAAKARLGHKGNSLGVLRDSAVNLDS